MHLENCLMLLKTILNLTKWNCRPPQMLQWNNLTGVSQEDQFLCQGFFSSAQAAFNFTFDIPGFLARGSRIPCRDQHTFSDLHMPLWQY